MSFVVSARKYRPQVFEEVLGQSHVTDTLKNAILADKLAHAFLFTGPRGVGKTTCARILAKIINSPDPKKAITEQDFGEVDIDVSLNIFELDAASNNSVENIRSLIEQVRFQPQQGKYKVFIIDEVHMLSQAAFNAFLKTLEEPPPYAIFILATTEKHKILPTILSRCQIFDFRRIQISTMIEQLSIIAEKENLEVDEGAKYVIAEKADGAMRDALSIFDRITSSAQGAITYQDVIERLNILDYDYYFKMTEALILQDRGAVLTLLNQLLVQGFEGDHFIIGLADHFRNLLCCKDEGTLHLMQVSQTLKDRYQNQTQMLSSSFLLSAMNLANECDIQYPKAKNKRLHVEVSLLKMCYLNQLIEHKPSQTLAQTPDLKKKSCITEPTKSEKPLQSQISSGISKASVSDNSGIPTIPTVPKIDDLSSNAKSPIVKAEAAYPKVQVEAETSEEEKGESTIDVELQNTPAVSSLDALLAKAKASEIISKNQTKEVDLALIQQVWNTYKEEATMPSIKSVLNKVELKVLNETLQIILPSVISKEMVQQEIKLIQNIRSSLNNFDLSIDFIVDKEAFPMESIEKPKKFLSFKEKFELMNEKNPQLTVLIKTLELKRDHNNS